MLLDRGWDFNKASSLWSFRRSGAVLSQTAVQRTLHERFQNLLVLLERGFKPSSGGKYRKESLFLDSRALDMKPDRFLALLRQRQREHWLQTKGEA